MDSHDTGASTVLRLSDFNLDQIGSIYDRLDELELHSSPPRIRNGFPSTTSCVALPCFNRWGASGRDCPNREEVSTSKKSILMQYRFAIAQYIERSQEYSTESSRLGYLISGVMENTADHKSYTDDGSAS
jgi:hypothetical protein